MSRRREGRQGVCNPGRGLGGGHRGLRRRFDRGAAGAGKIDVALGTNAGGGTYTVTVQQSSDTTNWTTVSNAALVTSDTAFISTNIAYQGQLLSTNFVPWPFGGVTTPTAATATFATPYAPALPYTNSATFALTSNGVYQIGFSVPDAGPYLRTTVVGSGTATNAVISATLTVARQY